MNTLLINKYEPKFLDELNFDNDYITYIKNLCNSDNLNILFVGNTGSGKSILIDAILYHYYNINNLESIKNNILYITSLKEQGISFYKNDVKIFCQSTSEIYNKKKTIVIDNLDTLSDINQNIFKIHINTYNKKVNFICSCTNLNKINSSLLNYFIIIKIKSIDDEKLYYIINKICNSENLNLCDNLKNNIIKYSNNSIKVLINNLEKYRILNDKLTFNISNINNNILVTDLVEYYDLCNKKERIKSYKKLLDIYKDGYSIVDIIEYMYINLKSNNNIVIDNKYNIIKILSNYLLKINNINEDDLIIYFITNDIIDAI